MLVKAGSAVDAFIEQIIPFVEKGDIIIDGGNSEYLDTQVFTRRNRGNLLRRSVIGRKFNLTNLHVTLSVVMQIVAIHTICLTVFLVSYTICSVDTNLWQIKASCSWVVV